MKARDAKRGHLYVIPDDRITGLKKGDVLLCVKQRITLEKIPWALFLSRAGLKNLWASTIEPLES